MGHNWVRIILNNEKTRLPIERILDIDVEYVTK